MAPSTPVLRLWGRTSAINVRKVVWCAQELGLALQRTDAGGSFGLVQEDDYLRLNPNGLVPLLQDGDLALWESNVIVRYLCARYGSDRPAPLYPQDLAERFTAEKWMDWQQTTVNPAGRHAFLQLIRTPPEQRQQALVDASVAQMQPLLERLDRHLAGRDHMVGTHFGMADIPLACEVHRWFGLPLPRPVLPNVERWYAGLAARHGAVGVLDQTLS